MNIIPSTIEEKIKGVDRQWSLYIGISSAIFAAWCAYRLIWVFYIAVTFGRTGGSLIFSFVLWGVIGAVAAIAAFGFLTRARQP